MSVLKRICTLKEVGESAASSGEFSFALKDFLDGFDAGPNSPELAHEPAFLASN